MLRFFKKKVNSPSSEELAELSELARSDVKEKWLWFNNAMESNPGVSLGLQVEMFAQPLSEFIKSKYPQLLLGGSQLFWLTVFTAIRESGTHPDEAVNAAIYELQDKYGGKG